MPDALASLIASMRMNKVRQDSYAIIQRALADTVDESVSFKLYKRYFLGAISGKTGGAYEHGTPAPYQVLTATLDSHVLPVAMALNITTAVLKIDTEGAECLIMKEAKKFFANIYVPYIMLEHHLPLSTVECVEEMRDILRDMSYYPYYIDRLGPYGVLDSAGHKTWGTPMLKDTVTGTGLWADILWKKIL